VTYTISPQNSSAFGAALTINNTSSTAWTSWTLTWTFANGQTVSNGNLWNGIASQSGANVTVTNQSYNGSVRRRRQYHRHWIQRHLERHHQRGTHGVLDQRNGLHRQLAVDRLDGIY
jgi:hypothetical protein